MRAKVIGWTALAVAVAGYLGALVAGALFGMGEIGRTEALIWGGAAAVAGEIGLWVAAGALGFTIFKRRQAILKRLFGRKDAAGDAKGA